MDSFFVWWSFLTETWYFTKQLLTMTTRTHAHVAVGGRSAR